MKTQRAILYLAVGVVCALVAALAAHRYLSQGGTNEPQVERVHILLATRDISFGERLVLPGEGEEEEHNVRFVAWPRNLVPAGAIPEEEKAETLGEVCRAWTDITQHEPILKPRVIADADFIPESMYLERVRVDREDIVSGLLRPGMSVDVLQMVDRRPLDFMRCVRLYAVGSLDRLGRPAPRREDDVSPNVLLLIRKEHRQDFIAADKSHELLLRPAAGPCGNGPVLVNAYQQEQVRRQEAGDLLAAARQLIEEGEYEDALSTLERAVSQYGELGEVTEQAPTLAVEARAGLAASLLRDAETALNEDADFSRTMSLLDRIERECPEHGLDERVADLRARAERALQDHRRAARFTSARREVEQAIARGRLPQAEEKLRELESFEGGPFQTEQGEVSPEEVYRQLRRRLHEAGSRYRLDRQVVETFVNDGQFERARQKIGQMKEQFPDHPQNPQLERLIEEAESSATEDA